MCSFFDLFKVAIEKHIINKFKNKKTNLSSRTRDSWDAKLNNLIKNADK
jgi:hypothetical protein